MMRLSDADGSALELTVNGYQFPDAAEPGKKYSWHEVAGEATCDGETWALGYPALTCAETPRLSAWLRNAADWLDAGAAAGSGHDSVPSRLTFLEPNLTFRVVLARTRDTLIVEVELDQEFRRPSNRGRDTPNDILRITCNAAGLRSAAAAWDDAWAPYPGGLV